MCMCVLEDGLSGAHGLWHYGYSRVCLSEGDPCFVICETSGAPLNIPITLKLSLIALKRSLSVIGSSCALSPPQKASTQGCS